MVGRLQRITDLSLLVLNGATFGTVDSLSEQAAKLAKKYGDGVYWAATVGGALGGVVVIVVGAVVAPEPVGFGAGIGLGMGVAGQVGAMLDGDRPWGDFSWKEVLSSTLIGAYLGGATAIPGVGRVVGAHLLAEAAKGVVGKLKDGHIFGAAADLAVFAAAMAAAKGIKAWREGAGRVVEVESIAERSPGLSEAWWRDWERAFAPETGVRPESPLERGMKPGEIGRVERPGPKEADALGEAGRELEGIRKANCFLAGTLVATRTGLRPIETVGSGDVVWSFDFRAGQWVECVVGVCHWADYEGQFVTLRLEDGTTLEATEDHPVWVVEGEGLPGRPQLKRHDAFEDSGLSLPGRWVHTQWLRAGDRLYGRAGKCVGVRSVEVRRGVERVYNLPVLGLPYYAVSPLGLLVHNSETNGQPKPLPMPGAEAKSRPRRSQADPDPIEIHHNLPRQFKAWFEDAGLDIEDFTEPLPRSVHRGAGIGLHSDKLWVERWNAAWDRFFDEFETAGEQQILEFLDELRAAHGLPPWTRR